MEATARYWPCRSTRMSGFLRSAPDLRPTEVITTIGSWPPRRVLARAPPEASYSATWSRTHCSVLGTYSPTRRVMSGSTSRGARGFPSAVATARVRAGGVEDLEGVVVDAGQQSGQDSLHGGHDSSVQDFLDRS